MWKYGIGILVVFTGLVWYYSLNNQKCKSCEGFNNYLLNWKYKWPRCIEGIGCHHSGHLGNPFNYIQKGFPMRHYANMPLSTRKKLHW